MKKMILIFKNPLKIIIPLILGIALVSAAAFSGYRYVVSYMTNEEEIKATLEDYFRQRGAALVSGDPTYIESQFDKSSTYGRWSFEHETKRIKYIQEWAEARKVKFNECQPKIKIFSIKPGKNSVKIYMSVRTKYVYSYPHIDPDTLNEFCLGTKHSITLVNKEGIWYVTVDWYSDPLEDSGVAGVINPTYDNMAPPEGDDIVETFEYARGRYNRAKAVEYADLYCGANWDKEDGYKYNSKYRNYADLGGDCANYASQILADKNGGNLRMGGGWLYRRGEASRAWVNAGSFTSHIMYSGKGRLVSKGKYQKAVNYTNQLSPGDIVSYEKKGDIVHVSMVTAKDSQGMLLVNSHTNDRYHVPWDLGWNSSTTFWLLRMND